MSVLRTSRRRRSALVAAAAVVALGGGGIAFAYWTSDGTGEGTATTGASSAFQVTSAPPVGDPLSPGSGEVQTVTYTVTNTNSGVQTLENFTAVIAEADGTVWAPTGCSADDYTVGAPTIAMGPIAGGAARNGTVTITMNETGADQDGCQNLDVPLYLDTAV